MKREQEAVAKFLPSYVVVAGVLFAVLVPFRGMGDESGAQDTKPDQRPLHERVLSDAEIKRVEGLVERIAELEKSGKFADAVPLAEEILTVRTRAQGADHWQTLDTMWSVKILKTIAGKPTSAQAEYRDYFKLAADLAKETPVDRQGLQKKGKRLQDRITRSTKLFGSEHPETAQGYLELGWHLNTLGNHAEAQKQLEKSASIVVRLFGETHPTAAGTYNALATALDNRGRYTEAQKFHAKALAIAIRLLGEESADVVRGYFGLGLNLYHQANYPEAQKIFEKALALAIKLHGEDHLEVAKAYNGLSMPIYRLGKYEEARKLMEKSLELQIKLLGESHPEIATGYNNIAFILATQGKNAEAQKYFEKSLRLYIQLYGEEHPYVATAYDNLGTNLKAQGKYFEAQELLEKALKLRIKLLTERHPSVAMSYSHVGLNLDHLAEHTKAQKLHRKALTLSIELLGDAHTQVANSYRYLASNFQHQARYTEARVLYEKSLAIRLQLHGEEHSEVGLIYHNLAGVFKSQGRYARAQELLEKALALRIKTLGPKHTHVASTYTVLGSVQYRQGNYAAAHKLYKKAVDLWVELHGEEHFDVAMGYNNLGLNYHRQRKFREAHELYEKSLVIDTELYGEDHPRLVRSYNNYARNLSSQGKFDAARKMFEKSLALAVPVLGEDHVDVGRCVYALAVNDYLQGKFGPAVDHLKRCIPIFEKFRTAVSRGGFERSMTIELVSPFPLLAVLLSRTGAPEAAWDALDRANGRGFLDDLASRAAERWTTEESQRASTLRARVTRLEAVLQKGADLKADAEAEKRRLAEVRQEFYQARSELSDFQSKLQEKYGIAIGQTYVLKAIQAKLRPAEALVGWLDVKQHTNSDDVQWAVVVRAKGAPKWVRISGSGPDGVWHEEDDARCDELAKLFSDATDADGPALERRRRKVARQCIAPLEDALGVHEGLARARHLIVLPSPALRNIPVGWLAQEYTVSYAPSGTILAWLRERERRATPRPLLALADPSFPEPPQDKKPDDLPLPPEAGLTVIRVVQGTNAERHGIRARDVLVRYGTHELRGLPDLRAAMGKTDPSAGKVSVKIWRQGKTRNVDLAPGRLGVELDARSPRQIALVARRSANLLRSLGDREPYDALPGTRAEVAAIAKTLKDRGEVMVLTGGDASETRLQELARSGELGEYRFIHFATHGKPHRVRAFDSQLILSQENLPDPVRKMLVGQNPVDGKLTAREVLQSWNLNAELVVLSACESGIGRFARGEGHLGFAQAFLIAGARSVVLSLWKVDDEATALLMTRFYENLLGGRAGLSKPLPRAEALREAQHWLRDLTRKEARAILRSMPKGTRATKSKLPRIAKAKNGKKATVENDRPFAHPHYWAAFILVGEPE